jgi:hypothetical protein
MIKIYEKSFTRLEANPVTGETEIAVYYRVFYF